MSFIVRLRRNLLSGFPPKPYISIVIASKTLKPIWVCRNYALPVRKDEEDEIEEVDIDPRKLPTDYDPANFDPTAHNSPPSEYVFRLVDEVSSLKLVEISELSSILRKKMDMKEHPVMGVLNPAVLKKERGLN